MVTDRQTPCLYYVCVGLCTKGRKADHAHYCQHCNKYKPRVRVRYKNQKKENLKKLESMKNIKKISIQRGKQIIKSVFISEEVIKHEYYNGRYYYK